ncbi:MAG: NAD(P)H-hydrate dehydratase, partial [bacterium]|nr:NAD(P)H-hydrate dehydratase [bacterium]
LQPLLPARPSGGHKGTFGHVFIIAGSLGFTGAAKLAAMAANRSGVGLVTVGAPRPLMDVVGASLLEAMSFPLAATDSESIDVSAVNAALEFAASRQAVVLGPGMSQDPRTREFVQAFVEQCPAPLLVDADGLNAVSADCGVLDRANAPLVVTPHPGEMARLRGVSVADVQSDREACASGFAEEHGCVTVLKGAGTVVAAPGGVCYTNPTGNSGMATGGTGDVSSGLIGGLMAQGTSPLDAALVGTYLHGLAGDIAARTQTRRGMVAGDVIESIPAAWRTIDPEEESSNEIRL